MNALDDLVRQELTPWFRESGYKKRGRNFLKVLETGLVSVSIHHWNRAEGSFYVDECVAPAIIVEALAHRQGVETDEQHLWSVADLWSRRLPVPADALWCSKPLDPSHEMWWAGLSADGSTSSGSVLLSALQKDIPWMSEMTDIQVYVKRAFLPEAGGMPRLLRRNTEALARAASGDSLETIMDNDEGLPEWIIDFIKHRWSSRPFVGKQS